MQTDTIQNRITQFINFLTEMKQSQIILNYNTKQLHIEKFGFVQVIPPNWGVSYHFDWPANRSRLPSRTIYRVPIKLI